MVLKRLPKVYSTLIQQMKSYDGIKIETVGVQLPTDQLKEELFRLNLHSRTTGGVSLNRHLSSPIDTSSIAITNYNIQRNSILLCHQLPTQSLTPPNNEASMLPDYGRVELLFSLLYRSTVGPLIPDYGRIDSQLTPMNWICSYFGDCSQSTICNATRFGECSSTLLDKLWYTYSYIYKPKQPFATELICF